MEESVVGMATSEEPEVGLTTSEEGKGEPDTMLVDTEAAAASGDVTGQCWFCKLDNIYWKSMFFYFWSFY